MFDLDKYLADLILNCRSAFGERLLYMGLQGSWLRGEAHENSDIDIMVILDRFSVRDMDTYRGILRESGVEIAQFLYPKTEYDLCIDSSNKSPAALAEEIVRSLT